VQLQEMEMENAKLKTDLASLRMLTAKGGQKLISKWFMWLIWVLLLMVYTFPFRFSLFLIFKTEFTKFVQDVTGILTGPSNKHKVH
jgi:hypothetical protein